MIEPVNTAVIYYSSTGNVYALARAAAEGAEKAGAEVRLRKVRELAPAAAIQGNPDWAVHAAATSDVTEASVDDLEWADVVIFGTPTRYGGPTSQLKAFIDTTGRYTDSIQFQTGNPYGTAHFAGDGHGPGPVDLEAARYQARRAVEIAGALATGRRA